MKEYLYLDKMITPHVITFVYWLLLIVVALTSLTTMFGVGMGPLSQGFTFWSFLQGLIVLGVGSVLVRVYCEIIIIFFNMNKNLEDIKNKK